MKKSSVFAQALLSPAFWIILGVILLGSMELHAGSKQINPPLTESGQPTIFLRDNRKEDQAHPEYNQHQLAGFDKSLEIIGLRTAYSRTFRLADGSFAIQSSHSPLHYWHNGFWLSLNKQDSSHKHADMDTESSGTYTDGHIDADRGFTTLGQSSSCPGSMTISIPAEALITGVNASYAMTAMGQGWRSDQRSQIRCTSPGGGRSSVYNVTGDTAGTQSYNHTNLNIANNVFGGGDIHFELHAGRTWGDSGCSNDINRVDNGTWTLTVLFAVPNTYYSYQSGSWDLANTWTTDPSGTILTGSAVPGPTDRAVILNGREVNIPTSNKTVGFVEIRDGSVLDLGNTTGHQFNALLGSGYLKLSSGSLPSGNMEAFVSETGGTIEFYGGADFTFNRNVFNNLVLNLTQAARVATVGDDFTVHGQLTINRGNFRIGNSTTNRTVWLNKDVRVNADGRISVGSFNNTGHNISIGGDLINQGGQVRFRNNDSYTYTSDPNNGRTTVFFNNPIANQLLMANGITYFHNLVVDKGIDDTYMLDVQANHTNNFRILGRNDGDATGINDPGSVFNNKALDIYAGTLRLGSNISIPRLLTGAGNQYFTIDSDARLWIDGAEVSITEQTNTSAIIIYGKLLITGNSIFSSTGRQGIILREAGSFELQGGNVTTTAFRTSSRLELGTHRGAFLMSGGTLNINGDNLAESHPAFALPFADNSFYMSGGEIHVLNSSWNTGGGLARHSWLVNSNPANIVVSGGSVFIYATAREARINSTAPFYNLILRGNGSHNTLIEGNTAQTDGGNTVVPATSRQPLVVLNNLEITERAIFIANHQQVSIGNQFTLGVNARYTPGNNTTIFNGESTQLFSNLGTISAPGLYNLSIENKALVSISQNLTVSNDLHIASATALRDMGRTIHVGGHIHNSGVHESQTGGAIILNGSGNQRISGNGQGVFGNLTLNKSAGITQLTTHIAIHGHLRLAGNASVLEIGTNRINLASTGRIYDHLTNTTTAGFSATRMIRTEGNASDGGLRIHFSNIQDRVFPLGVGNKYTPAWVSFTNPPAEYGSITIRPVNASHPHLTDNQGLNYYWKVSSTGFTGIGPNSLIQRFFYQNSDVPTGINQALLVPAVYNPSFWEHYTTADVAQTIREIRFNQILQPDGEFTAGYTQAFGGIAAVYSIGDGDWANSNIWTNDPITNTPLANYTPKADDPVVIRAPHQITVRANNARAGSLLIHEGASLDLGVFTGHQLGTAYGKGRLKISSATPTAQFPEGDFGEFLGENGGTVEYYTTGAINFNIPPFTTGQTLIETFTSVSFPPVGWSTIDAGTGSASWMYSTTLGNPAGAAVINDVNNGQANNDFLITPRLLPTNQSQQFRFDIRRRDGTNGTYQVGVSTTGTSIHDFEIIANGTSTNNFVTVSIDLNEYIGLPLYVAIISNSRRGSRIDNITGPPVFLASNAPTNYNHLVISPSAGNTIILGNTDLSIYGNLTILNAGNVNTNNSLNTTITLEGHLFIQDAAELTFQNGSAAHIVVKGNTHISSSRGISVAATGTAVPNRLSFYGDVHNEGVINLRNNGRYAEMYFAGTELQTYSGDGTNNLNRLYLQKGSSQQPMLDVTSANFSLNTGLNDPLHLQSGSLRFSNPDLTATLSTQTVSIAATAALIVNGAHIRLATANSHDANLLLSGRIQVDNGTLSVGDPGITTARNDIEYPAAGQPEIVVTGGVLNVNGQIRRNLNLRTGALQYRQHGGTVNIYGRVRTTTQAQNRALLEVVNPGSRFEMTGGEIILHNGLANATSRESGDLYLNAEQATVSGGTIQIGHAATPADHFFNLYLANPVWNLKINGENQAKVARLSSVPAVIYNDLLIEGPDRSQFRANNLPLTIGGELISSSARTYDSFDRGAAEQQTTFNGRKATSRIRKIKTHHPAQEGGFNFGRLTIDVGASHIMDFAEGEIWINGIGEFLSGQIQQTNTNWMGALGDLYINEGIKWTANGRTLALRATTHQQVFTTGMPALGLIQIRNANGVSLQGDLQIMQGISFHTGILNIGQNLLEFSAQASISGTVNNNNMIITNGTLSDKGLRKNYGAAASSFTFPIGVAGKYTPATIQLTSTGGQAGQITLKAINSLHPATALPLNDELQYYWHLESSGFNNPTANLTFTYAEADVRGVKTNYVGARYAQNQWFRPLGNHDSNNNRLSINGHTALSGEYTLGVIGNFQDKPVLYSRGNHQWFDGNAWSVSPTGTPVFGAIPNGNPVIIQSGHTITINNNGAYAYSVDISNNARLQLGTTFQHNLGHVIGDGSMNITATSEGSFIFPGGDYTQFMESILSTIEYVGNGTLPAAILTYSNIKFQGPGTTKNIPAINLVVRRNLSIEQGFLNNTLFNRQITVGGHWVNQTPNGFLHGLGRVVFNGLESSIQSNGTQSFHDLQINRSQGQLQLLSPVEVNNSLILSQGFILTSPSHMLTLNNPSAAAISGGSANAYVDGPLRKLIITGQSFNFPVGNTHTDSQRRYGPVSVLGTITSGNAYWTAQYHSQVPLNRDVLQAPLQAVSTNEYWSVAGPADARANIRLRWDNKSEPIPAQAAGRQKLRVAKLESNRWNSVGQNVQDNGIHQGTLQTSTPQVFEAGGNYFTLGLDETATAQITGIAHGINQICNIPGATMSVLVGFTGDGPWDFTYRINGLNQPKLLNRPNPTQIILGYEQLYAINGAGTYTLNLVQVNDHNGLEGVILAGSAELTLLETPNPSISGAVRAIIGSSVVFTAPDLANHTYSWTVSGVATTSQSGATTPSFTVQWGSATGTATISLTQRNTLSGCEKTVTHLIDVINWPVIVGPLNVCANTTHTYTTNSQAGHSYTWTAIDGTIASGQGTASVQVTWSSSSAGRLVLRQGPSGSQLETQEDITILAPPAIRTLVSYPICQNTSAQIRVPNAQSNTSYQLKLQSNMSNVGVALEGNGSTIQLPTGNLTTNTSFVVTASNAGCAIDMPVSVPVKPNNGEFHWAGSTSQDWFSSSNWACGSVPIASSDVFITTEAPLMPVITNSSAALVRHLQIGTGSALSINPSALMRIHGNMVLHGNMNASDASVEFVGSSLQTVQANATIMVQNLTVNNASGIQIQTNLSIGNQLNLNLGRMQITAGNHLRIGSASNTGSINRTNGWVQGEVQRWISNSDNYVFPIGTATHYRGVSIQYNENPVAGYLSMNFQETMPYGVDLIGNLPLWDGDLKLDNFFDGGTWKIDPISGLNSAVTYNIRFAAHGIPNILEKDDLRMIKRSNNGSGGWHMAGTFDGADETTDGVLNYITVKMREASGFSYYAMASSLGSNPLPIELLYFKAEPRAAGVNLSWATASETNNDFFTLERSKDGLTFEIIAIINSKAPHGHSNNKLFYSYEDSNPLPGLSYYRLKQTDFDGSYDYSEMVSVFLQNTQNFSSSLYPNPNKGVQFYIQANGFLEHEKITLTLSDAFGKTVYQDRLITNEKGALHQEIIPANKLTSGIYVIVIRGMHHAQTFRMIVQ